ncbi:MAG: PIG-L family deacetylase [Burkholderiaceae bacterium]|nr:PIG-L family deacetylase [Burkholderiaceae bacterium]
MKILNLLFACTALLLANSALANTASPSLAQCHGVKDLVFAAHMDDDLLFMNPDISATIHAKGCLQVVYLTASDRGEGTGYMLGRERGVQAAYAHIAGTANRWTETAQTYDARQLAHFTLDGSPGITLLQMRIQDPWLGKGWGSLTPLSRAESEPGQVAESLEPYIERYTRTDLVNTIAAIIQQYQPTTLRYMDATITIAYTALCWRCAGNDHPDHIASARLVRDAMQQAGGNYARTGYLNYPSQEREPNLTAAEVEHKTSAFLEYARNDYRYCPVPAQCQGPAGPEASWVSRIYYVSHSDTPAVLLPDATQGYSLFAVGEHNRAGNLWQSHTQQWSSLGGRTADSMVAFNMNNGADGVLMRDANGRLWFKSQDGPGLWRGWQALDGPRLMQLPSMTAQGSPAAIAMGNDQRFYYAQQAGADNSWSNWVVLPVLPRALPTATIARSRDGHLLAFAADLDGTLWLSSQSTTLAWSVWQVMDGVKTDGGLAAIRNSSDLIELYLRDQKTGHMLRMTQALPGDAQSAWNTPVDLGFPYIGQPTTAIDEFGAVVVAALDRPGGSIWLSENGQAQQLPMSMASVPTLRLINGVLHMAARATTTAQDYWVMTRSNGIWLPPQAVVQLPLGGGGAFH